MSTPWSTRDDGGQAPLSLAAVNGYPNIVEFLAGHGADMEAANYWGQPPLSRAVDYGNMEIVEFLRDVIEERRQLSIASVGRKSYLIIGTYILYYDRSVI